MRNLKWLRVFFLQHPLLWVITGILLFSHVFKLPADSWNVELLIARNLLRGFGYVVGPLDPPALWRPPLGVFLLVPLVKFISDPAVVFTVFGTGCLVGFLVSVFYLTKMTCGTIAGHVSQLIILSIPAFTNLNQQPTILGYLPLLGLATLSILVTLWSWQHVHWKWDLLAGLSWGITFLARPESMLLLGTSLISGIIFHRAFGTTTTRAVLRFVLQLTVFLAIYEPSVLIFKSVQKRYDLVGQEALMTYYAGSHLAGNQMAGDIATEGYAETVARFGKPEKYNNSLIRFAIANPGDVYRRIRQNLLNFADLLSSSQFLCFWDLRLFFGFTSILLFSRPTLIPPRIYLGYTTLLVLSSPYFLLFHMDSRYALLFLVTLILWIPPASLAFWKLVAAYVSERRKWLLVLPVLGLVFLCAVRVNVAANTATTGIDSTPWRELATTFRQAVGQGTPVVEFFSQEGNLVFAGDYFWFSYFAGTALPWCGNPNCDVNSPFPQTRIYSFLGKSAEYVWVSDDRFSALKNIPIEVIRQHVPITGMGSYSLVRPGKAVDPVNSAIMSAVFFTSRFVENSDIDKVSCKLLGLVPDGKPDGIIEVVRQYTPLSDGTGQSARRTVNLLRERPGGIYTTSGSAYILGISETPGGPLLNFPDGRIPRASRPRLYLHFCRDGYETPESTYTVDIEGEASAVPVQK